MKRILTVIALAALAACREDATKASPAMSAAPIPPPAPSPAPAPTQVTAPTPTAAAVKKPIPLPGFAGFSKDGKTFAWVDLGSGGTGLLWARKVTLGDKQPKMSILSGDMDAGAGSLTKEGFSAERKAPPADLTLETDLTARPPKVVLKRGDKTTTVPQGDAPYPPTDTAEIWGVSADGKHVAVHISGPDVPGVLSKGGNTPFHFVFVAPMP